MSRKRSQGRGRVVDLADDDDEEDIQIVRENIHSRSRQAPIQVLDEDIKYEGCRIPRSQKKPRNEEDNSSSSSSNTTNAGRASTSTNRNSSQPATPFYPVKIEPPSRRREKSPSLLNNGRSMYVDRRLGQEDGRSTYATSPTCSTSASVTSTCHSKCEADLAEMEKRYNDVNQRYNKFMQDYDNKRTECLEKDVEISQLRNEVLMLTTQPMANPVSFDKEIQVSAVYLDKGVQTSRVSIPANKKDKRVEPISRISSGDNSENDEFRPSFEHYFTRIVRSYTDKTVLDQVMEKLSCANLKTCYFVNKYWMNKAALHLRDVGFISMKSYSGDEETIAKIGELVELGKKSPLFPSNNYKITLSGTLMNQLSANKFLILQTHITRLILISPVSSADIQIQKLRDYLPSSLPNLKSLELKFPCTLLSSPLVDVADDDYREEFDEDFGVISPTNLKELKVDCICTNSNVPKHFRLHKTHFRRGLLFQLLSQSPNLEAFDFNYNPSPIAPNKNLLKYLGNLLNEVVLKDLTKLKITSRLEAPQDLEIIEFQPRCHLKTIYLSGISWKQVERIWFQHSATLETVIVGEINKSLDIQQIKRIVFENVTNVVFKIAIDTGLLSTFTKDCFPNVVKLEMKNPEEAEINHILKKLTHLQELTFEFTEVVVENDQYKWLHLDSLLSGFSISQCESVLDEIRNNGFPKELNLDRNNFEVMPACSIQHLRALRKLAIKCSNKSLVHYRITEVSLVLVLFRMKSLTSITVENCQLLNGTMEFIKQNISPAVYLHITTPELTSPQLCAKRSLLYSTD